MAHGTDTALRANVRLLGEILGRVLVEQEGEETYALEERVRLLARLGRRGDAGARRALAETVAVLDVPRQGTILRAFTLYFHLANIAEQHHQVRRPRGARPRHRARARDRRGMRAARPSPRPAAVGAAAQPVRRSDERDPGGAAEALAWGRRGGAAAAAALDRRDRCGATQHGVALSAPERKARSRRRGRRSARAARRR